MLVGALITGAGWLGRNLWKSWREAQQGRKDEAQKRAEERDLARKEAKDYFSKKNQWESAYYALEHTALRHGVPQSELPETPDNRH